MKKFTIEITETSYGFVEIEAESLDEAREKAEEAVFNGEAVFNNTQVKIVS